MARPFVSVLVDTYNHERFIEQAIASVLEQDFPAGEREIIVVDDGSSDRTPEIIRKFAPHLRLIRKANGGQASAFNTGIPECRGEIIAFLDGDDWWKSGKLSAVARALAAEPEVGLVGHGITEVFSDGRHHTELLRETPRFRITSESGAKAFRLRKSFLGTSRMSCRKKVLELVGRVPETLAFEADEYIFTLAGVFSQVLILRESFTFYRQHERNTFQISDGNEESARRKYRILTALAGSLREKLREHGLRNEVARIVLDSVETEADLIRLGVDGGFPWETIQAEYRNYRIVNEEAPRSRLLFKCLTLLPAAVMPARLYYSVRRRCANSRLYLRFRQKWLPIQPPPHVDRHRTLEL